MLSVDTPFIENTETNDLAFELSSYRFRVC